MWSVEKLHEVRSLPGKTELLILINSSTSRRLTLSEFPRYFNHWTNQQSYKINSKQC